MGIHLTMALSILIPLYYKKKILIDSLCLVLYHSLTNTALLNHGFSPNLGIFPMYMFRMARFSTA